MPWLEGRRETPTLPPPPYRHSDASAAETDTKALVSEVFSHSTPKKLTFRNFTYTRNRGGWKFVHFVPKRAKFLNPNYEILVESFPGIEVVCVHLFTLRTSAVTFRTSGQYGSNKVLDHRRLSCR